MQNVHNTTTTLNTDLKAAQSNFLLKGFFNKKKKKAQKDSIEKAKALATPAGNPPKQ
jgi:phospholipid/cholesterol/gamma-HCH transport system substrate-binding protein